MIANTTQFDPRWPELVGKRILVVEDIVLLACDLKRRLELVGCTVIGPASTPSWAFQLAREEPLDGALLDIDLQGAPSTGVAIWLRRCGVPVIFTTGYASDSLPPGDLRDCPLLSKPLDFDNLADVLCAELTGRTSSDTDASCVCLSRRP